MDAERKVRTIIAEHRLPLLRQNKHQIYRLPNGRNLVVSCSPRDNRHGWSNLLSTLRRELNLKREEA